MSIRILTYWISGLHLRLEARPGVRCHWPRQSAVGNRWIMSLNHSDIQAVSEVLRELYANTNSATLPHCIVRLLHRIIPADSAVYNSFNFRTGEMQVVHDHGPDGDRYLPALQRHVEQHPLMVHVRAHWKEGAETLSNVISRRQLRQTGIYSEFLHPLGIEEQIGLLKGVSQ